MVGAVTAGNFIAACHEAIAHPTPAVINGNNRNLTLEDIGLVASDDEILFLGAMAGGKIHYHPIRPNGYTNGVKDMDGDYNASYYEK